MLVKLLLKRHFCVQQEVHFYIGAPEADACVVIGDRALRTKPALKSYDLAAEWKNMTSLPFVFAVWAHWKDRPDSRRLSGILHVAKNVGCKAIVELSKLYSKRVDLSEARCRHYLTSCIHYDLGPAEKRGMQLFGELYKNLIVTHKQTTKEESIRTRRIIRNERESRAIEPILTRLR